MTLFDQQTELLPAPQPTGAPEPARSRGAVLAVVLAAILVVLLASVLAIAETVLRGEAEQRVAEEVRSRAAIPPSERVQVDIAGSVLAQLLVGRFGEVAVTVYSFPTGRANADLTMGMRGLRLVDGEWTPEEVSGAAILSAAQATALFVPAEAQNVMRVDFSGGDVVLSGTVTGGATSVTVSLATTPRFENGRLSAAISAVTINDKALSPEEVAAQTGADLSTMQSAPVCLADMLPSFVHPRDVRVDDHRLRIEYDIDVAASETTAGREPGSCP